MARHDLLTGNLYTYESWDQYWEGTLKRVNGNIGTITTRTNIWSANYGVTDRLNVIAMRPVRLDPRQSGRAPRHPGLPGHHAGGEVQLSRDSRRRNGPSLRAIAVASAGIPLTDYNPELPPLSIGSGSTRVSGRGTLNLQSTPGWFLNGSTAYTWRSEVAARPALLLHRRPVRDEQPGGHAQRVRLRRERRLHEAGPDDGLLRVAATDAGRRRHPPPGHAVRVQPDEFLQGGRHGGCTRFPSCRTWQVTFAYAYTLDGRNVGQATTFTGGLLYSFAREASSMRYTPDCCPASSSLR